MFGIGTTEFLLICIVALVVLGPRRLPEIAYKIGKVFGSLRRMSSEFQRNLNVEVAILEEKERQTQEQAYNTMDIPCHEYNSVAESDIKDDSTIYTTHEEERPLKVSHVDVQANTAIVDKNNVMKD